MSYRTISDLVNDIRFRFDVEGFTDRHPTATLERLVAVAYRDVRQRLTSEGVRIFVTPTQATESVAGPTSGYPGTVLSAFTTYVWVQSVQVLDGSSWQPLARASLESSPWDDDLTTCGLPRYWSLIGQHYETDTGATRDATGLRILVWPSLDQARQFRVIGVQGFSDASSNTTRILTDFGLDKYLIASVGVDLAMRDDDAQLYQARVLERDQAYMQARKALRATENGPVQRTNVRGRRFRWG